MAQPFFILGLGRSGSQLLFRILQAHSKIALTSEARVADFLHFVSQFGSVARGQESTFDYPTPTTLKGIVSPWEIEHWSAFLRDRVPLLLEEWYRARFPDREFTHWGDKLPLPRTAAGLQAVFPTVRFLVLARDPRGFVQSLLDFRQRPDARALDPELAEFPVERLARDWRNSYHDFLRYLRHVHVVRYEDLQARPEEITTQALEFLGLEPEPQMFADEILEFAAGHATSSSVAESISRWRRDLSAEDRRCIEDVCSDVMAELGYD